MRFRRILAAALVPAIVTAFATTLVTARVASAQPSPAPVPGPAPAAGSNAAAADAKIASAKAHFAKAEMGAALADLAEAYHLDPRPDLLYAMAQIEIELGDCGGAIAHYKAYLATNPSQKARDAAEKSKAACEVKLGITPDTTTTTTEPKAIPPTHVEAIRPVPPPEPATTTVRRPFYKDGLGDGLAAGAIVVGAAGGFLYLKARGDIDDSETAATLQAHDDLVSKAHDLRLYAVIAGSVGGALAIGAIVRWTTHGGGTETRERVEVAVGPSPDGTGWGVAALGRF